MFQPISHFTAETFASLLVLIHPVSRELPNLTLKWTGHFLSFLIKSFRSDSLCPRELHNEGSRVGLVSSREWQSDDGGLVCNVCDARWGRGPGPGCGDRARDKSGWVPGHRGEDGHEDTRCNHGPASSPSKSLPAAVVWLQHCTTAVSLHLPAGGGTAALATTNIFCTINLIFYDLLQFFGTIRLISSNLMNIFLHSWILDSLSLFYMM